MRRLSRTSRCARKSPDVRVCMIVFCVETNACRTCETLVCTRHVMMRMNDMPCTDVFQSSMHLSVRLPACVPVARNSSIYQRSYSFFASQTLNNRRISSLCAQTYACNSIEREALGWMRTPLRLRQNKKEKALCVSGAHVSLPPLPHSHRVSQQMRIGIPLLLRQSKNRNSPQLSLKEAKKRQDSPTLLPLLKKFSKQTRW